MYILNLLLFVLAVGFGAAQDLEEGDSLITSTAGLEQLLETEYFLINNLDNYAEELEQKLIFIRSLITSLREDNEKTRKNPEYYISIPTNIFALVRRLQKDWVYLDAYMAKSVGEAQIKILRDYRQLKLPKEADFVEAVIAITRIQDTYDLKAEDLARGVINGKPYDSKLTALDCYSLGHELLRQEDYINAGYWLFAAIGLYEGNILEGLHDLSQLKILKLYIETLLKQGRYQDTQSVLNAILTLTSLATPQWDVVQKKTELERHIQTYHSDPEHQIQSEPNLCQRNSRGEFSSKISTLYCLYNATTTAFLKLAPLKMEIISLDPYLVLFHDVMSDEEISTLQKISLPLLSRAKVYIEKEQRSVVTPRRTSKMAWLSHTTNAITERINKRIEDMTGFNLTNSEELQVINYGLGGHCAEHYDFFDVPMNTDVVAQQGDRKATVLFYMTDVDQGGVTVFPNLDIAVFPKKGTALMWYNLNNRYEKDYRTFHAGCPVLVGSKWVMSKWIRERNQVFRLPCYDS